MFNFEDKKIEKKDVAIFNNGQAGRAEGVTLKVLKKGVDYEGEQVPNYKIECTDAYGKVEIAYYYLSKEKHNPQYDTYEEAVEKQWRKVGSILSVCGENPAGNFATATEMLDNLMSRIKTAAVGKTFRVFANYGHKNNPRKWLQVRSWAPFIELEGTDPSTLKAMNIDQMERLVPNENSTNTSDSDSSWS